MGNVNESASQQFEGIIDNGAENFAVDLLSNPAEEIIPEDSDSDDETSQNDDDQDDINLEGKDEDDNDDDDQDEGSDTSAEDDDQDDGDTDSQKKSDDDDQYSARVLKRINKISAKRKAAEATVTQQQEEITSLNERLVALEGKKDLNKKPDVEDYDTEEEFEEAKVDWKVNKKLAEQAKIDNEAKLNIEYSKVETKIQGHMEKGAKKYKDFAGTVQDLSLKRSLLPEINDLKNASDVIYYLGKNSDVADNLNDYVASNQTIKAGKLLQKISSSIKGKKFTRPPKPIRPIKPKGGGLKDMEAMSNAEYRKMRHKQAKTKRW
ncbi:MAG: hypothetical protein DRH93_11655 [Deltaproteobacteria bacterium]|nr:MAG: hypothetical protein DRH93_11655 [Deltaproteobacteria bacterium]